LIRDHLITHLNLATLALFKADAIPNTAHDLIKDTDKLFLALIPRVNDNKLRSALDSEYKHSISNYQQALAKDLKNHDAGQDSVKHTQELKELIKNGDLSQLNPETTIQLYEALKHRLVEKDKVEALKKSLFKRLNADQLNVIYEHNKAEKKLIQEVLEKRNRPAPPTPPTANPPPIVLKVDIKMDIVEDLKTKEFDQLVEYVKGKGALEYTSALLHAIHAVDRSQLTPEKVLEFYELTKKAYLSRPEIASFKNIFFKGLSSDLMQKIWEKYPEEAIASLRHLKGEYKRNLKSYMADLVPDDVDWDNIQTAVKFYEGVLQYPAQAEHEIYYKEKKLKDIYLTFNSEQQKAIAEMLQKNGHSMPNAPQVVPDSINIADLDIDTAFDVVRGLKNDPTEYAKAIESLVSRDIKALSDEKINEFYLLIIDIPLNGDTSEYLKGLFLSQLSDAQREKIEQLYTGTDAFD